MLRDKTLRSWLFSSPPLHHVTFLLVDHPGVFADLMVCADRHVWTKLLESKLDVSQILDLAFVAFANLSFFGSSKAIAIGRIEFLKCFALRSSSILGFFPIVASIT